MSGIMVTRSNATIIVWTFLSHLVWLCVWVARRSVARWFEGTGVKRSAIRRHVPHPFSPANNCCRYIFKLHTLRYNLQAFNLPLILLLILLLSNWPLVLPVWLLLGDRPCCCPFGPFYRPIGSLPSPVWLLLSPVWPLMLSPLVWALLSSDWLLSSPVWSLLSLLWHLSSRAVLQPVWQLYSPPGQKIYNTISFSSLREWTAHIKIVHGITYRCLEACCLYT